MGIEGVAKVVSDAYSDFDQFDQNSYYFDPKVKREKPIWFVVYIKFVSKTPQILALKTLKATPELANLKLFKQSRLSVLPVNSKQWDFISAVLD